MVMFDIWMLVLLVVGCDVVVYDVWYDLFIGWLILVIEVVVLWLFIEVFV